MSAEKQLVARVVTALRNNLAQLLQELDDILDHFAPPEARRAKKPAAPKPAAPPGAPTSEIPQLDIAELEAADWTSYATKQKAAPGENAWLKNPEHFTSYDAPPVILELLAAIKRTAPKLLQIGDMNYYLSGAGKFISRKPTKQEGAR
jgi:hypothetical protein